MAKLKSMLQRFFLLEVCVLFLSVGTALAAPVVLDAGHGGASAGVAGGKQGLREKDITLSLAKSVFAALKKSGLDASLLREVDRNMDPGERAAAISDKAMAALLSLHVSVNEDFNIYVFNKAREGAKEYMAARKNSQFYAESKAFALALAESLKEVFPASKVNLVEMPLPLLGAAGAPAALLETPHPDTFNYSDDAAKGLLTAAIVNGITRFNNGKR